MVRASALSIAAASFVLLSACSDNPAAPKPVETDVPDDIANGDSAPAQLTEQVAGATPMEERVATLGLINKRNNETQDLELRPGDSQRVGAVIVRLQACERTAPWELPQETGAFVQVLVQDRNSDDFSTVFSGWLFKNSPSVNVVEHPIYDVWVKDCAMNFPGEE